MKSKKNFIILAIVIAISLIGVTYAFFDYYMLGSNQKITAGKVNLVFNEGEDTIDRGNIFPETAEKARSRDDNFITFTVSGINTTEDQDIWYEIILNEGDEETGMTRFAPEDLVFDLVELNDNGTEGTYLVDALSYNDFNARRIWVNTVSRDTSLTVNKTYKLRMWLSDKVLISDSNTYADYKATGYENHYASVKVSVYGDFIEKEFPYSYMANLGVEGLTFWPESIETVKTNITEVNFVSMDQNLIDARFETATIKEDLTVTSEVAAMTPLATTIENNTYGSVKAWLQTDPLDATKYIMYVASDGITFFPSDCTRMFYSFTNLKNINFENVNTRNVTNMFCMFNNCGSLIELGLSNFDTSQVTDMSYMFGMCGNLMKLEISSFDTSKVTTMVQMFRGCGKLTAVDVSNFDTSQVTDMSYMFWACNALVKLDVGNFNTSKVTNMCGTFGACYALTELDVNNFDTSQVTNMQQMFWEGYRLTNLDVNNFDTSSVDNMSAMFAYCSSLTNLDLSNFNTNKVTDMSMMFYDCSILKTIYVNSDWNISNTITSTDMFVDCDNLVGAVAYSKTNANDITLANPITGYFTKKEV